MMSGPERCARLPRSLAMAVQDGITTSLKHVNYRSFVRFYGRVTWLLWVFFFPPGGEAQAFSCRRSKLQVSAAGRRYKRVF